MELTEIKVFPVKEEKLKAFVSIVIDRCFMVNDIKVIKGRDGLFISMPSRRKKNGKFKDVAHPLNNETRQMIERLILAEYESAVSGTAGERPEAASAAAPVSAEAPQGQAPEPVLAERPAPPPAAEPAPEPPAPVPAASAPAAPPAPEPTVAETQEPEDPAPQTESGPEEEKSLEEVAELHLRDSFWNS